MKATHRTGVYLWKCIPTGKVYVGSAAKSFKQRHNNHKLELRKNKHANRYLQHAWNKYGKDEFIWIEIEVCPAEMCIEREQYWLDYYDATNPKKGFNLSPTAGNCLGVKHPPRPRELIEAQMAKIREYLKDPAYRKKIGDATREGLSVPEVKKKLSENLRNRWGRMSPTERKEWIGKRNVKIKAFWDSLTEEEWEQQRKFRSDGRKAYFKNMTLEEKAAWTERMTEAVNRPEARARKVASVTASWANASPEQLSQRHKQLAEASKAALRALDSKTPEEKKEFFARRAAAIKEAKRKKRKRRLQEMLWKD